MSRVITLHQEIKIANRWEHLNVRRIDLYTLMNFMDAKARNKGLPADANIITVLDLTTDAHTVRWCDELDVMWLEENCPRQEFKDQIGYFLGTTWSSWLREPKLWDWWKENGLTDFRWVWWTKGA